MSVGMCYTNTITRFYDRYIFILWLLPWWFSVTPDFKGQRAEVEQNDKDMIEHIFVIYKLELKER